ncbi:hypothetical protein AB0M35_27470 [Micromonospora sp. NPDC051196]|uniref:hypothetical protein n=1 Tax=Micromonospora sp. NPDC051196 TaxID=3155281 RepID=UPI00342D2877
MWPGPAGSVRVIRSRPARTVCQRLAQSGAPGNRPAIPITAISRPVRSSGEFVIEPLPLPGLARVRGHGHDGRRMWRCRPRSAAIRR